jgi:hypothetical protein
MMVWRVHRHNLALSDFFRVLHAGRERHVLRLRVKQLAQVFAGTEFYSVNVMKYGETGLEKMKSTHA